MKSAKIIEINQPLQIYESKTPKPKGSQVLVKVQSSGVCHSDIHLWEGGYQGPEGQFLKTTDRGVKYPLTPGHEVAIIIIILVIYYMKLLIITTISIITNCLFFNID